MERAKAWQKRATRFVTSGKFKSNIGGYAPQIGAVACAIVIVWYLPLYYIRRKFRRRSAMTANWPRIVFWTGIFGLLAYWIGSFWARDKRELCPACKGNLSNVDLYTDYKFDYCPHCGHKITPVFSFQDLITTTAKVLAKRRESDEDSDGWESMMEVLTMTFLFAFRSRSSDIHFEPEQDRLLVRFRIDGIMYDMLTLPVTLAPPVISAIKGRSNLDIAEKRVPQDGHFSLRYDDVDLNVRVSTLPTRMGEKAVLRLLDRRNISMHLLEMGFPEENANRFMDNVFSAHGIILSSGPTGSGKTTLLYSALQQLNDGTRNVVTIEDPIEYEISGINQTQHNPVTGLTFATALRSILRQDPDVIMVGEIRDHETASIAVNAALTGHMVLSTVHTIDAPTALARLIDMKVDVKQLASAMLCIVAQRLVRKLCRECRKERSATSRDVNRIPGLEVGQEIHEAKGCDFCLQTGYRGRTGLFEVLFITDDIRRAVIEGASVLDIGEQARATGMTTLREEGLKKVLDGTTSIDEVVRVTQDVSHEGTE